LKSKLLKGERLTFYSGIDPTGTTLHLGHIIPLRKLAQLQRLGHKIIFLIGDFTAMIGDPTDKTALRKKLTREEVLHNCKEYQKQAEKFISFKGDNKAELKFNSEWLSKMNFGDVLELASQMTVDQMLKRDMFVRRMEENKPIYIHEFMYPLMQGYDSVAMDVDGEIGGNDQTFNMLAGRHLLKSIKDKEKFVIATKLLTDSSGKKMGKTEGNMVSLNQSPEEMFGKIMSWSDELIIPGFEICTDISLDEIETIKKSLQSGENPKIQKIRLAQEIVSLIYDKDSASRANLSFENTFSKGEIPEDIQEVEVNKDSLIRDALVKNSIVTSNTDWRRLIESNAVTYAGREDVIKDPNLKASENCTLRIGKKRFAKIRII
jgi:tyrosyl-tRNA synthetase